MKFINFVIFALICVYKNLVKATKFGPMAESLALGDVEFRTEEIISVNQKDYYSGKAKLTKNLKNSSNAKNENKKRLSAFITNNCLKLGNFYKFSLFALSFLVVLF